MPSRKPAMAERTEWTLNLSPGPECSVGYSDNEAVNWDGSVSQGRPNEDRFYTCYFQDSIQLYMVLDGHDGTKAVEFARPHIPHFLLQRDFSGGEKAVLDAFRSAIINTEQEFFLRIDGQITRKLTLQMEIEQKAPDADSGMAYRLFPTQIAEIGRLDELIKGGTTVVAALIYDNKLYVANVGDSRALLCSQNSDGTLARVEQLSVDHNTSNEDELHRLAACGLDPNKLRQDKRLGMQQNTRSIGDHSIKGGYHNVDILRHATSQPGIADPHLHRAVDLATFHGFLILMSDGLYEAYEAWTGKPERVNSDIAHLVALELSKCPDLKMVAQNVVEKVKHLYRETCKRDRRSGRLDDITLVIKSLIGGHSIFRTQSLKSHHHPHHPQMEPPATAPITDKHFEFKRTHPQQYPPYGQPQPVSFSVAPPPQRPPPGDYWRQHGYPPPPANPQGYPPGYYPPPDQHRPRLDQPYPQASWQAPGGDPGRVGGAPYYVSSQEEYRREDSVVSAQPPPGTLTGGPRPYHPSMSTPGGGGGYPSQPVSYGGGDQTHQKLPHDHVTSYYPQTSQPPPPQHTRQGSDQNPANRDQHPYENVSQNTKIKAPKPPPPDPPVSNDETPPPPLPPRIKPVASTETLPPPDKQEDEDDMSYMYKESKSEDTPDTANAPPAANVQESPQKPVVEPVVRIEQAQPLQNEPEKDVHVEKPPETLEEPEDSVDSQSNGNAGVVYYDDDDEQQGDEEPPVETTDDDGTIQPYIRFTERFPTDLSWNEIKIPS